jgi:hypothetical protein
MRTITDGQTDTQMMAAGSFVTWTHYSVRYEVIWDKKAHVHADIGTSARARLCIRTDIGPSAWTRSSLCPRPPSVSPRLPCADGLLRPRGGAKKNKNNNFFLIFFFGCWLLEKRGKKCSVFGFQSPRSPRSPSSPGFVGEAARRRRFFWPSSPY